MSNHRPILCPVRGDSNRRWEMRDQTRRGFSCGRASKGLTRGSLWGGDGKGSAQIPFCAAGRKRLRRRWHLAGRAGCEDALPVPAPSENSFSFLPRLLSPCTRRPEHPPHKRGRKNLKKKRKKRGILEPPFRAGRGQTLFARKQRSRRFPSLFMERSKPRCNFLLCLSSGKSLGLGGCSPSVPGGQPGTAPSAGGWFRSFCPFSRRGN